MGKNLNKMIIAGVDEAGRGALAGPVVAAAVINGKQFSVISNQVIKDSKVLAEKQREEAYEWIIKNCDFGIGIVDASEVDAIGIKKATNKAMQIAVKNLKQTPEELWVDGRDRFVFDIPSKDFVRGDALHKCISAASIIAKVTRDNLMKDYHELYLEFGFAKNKGYGAPEHLKLLEQEIYTPMHRKTYDPLRTILTQGKLF